MICVAQELGVWGQVQGIPPDGFPIRGKRRQIQDDTTLSAKHQLRMTWGEYQCMRQQVIDKLNRVVQDVRRHVALPSMCNHAAGGQLCSCKACPTLLMGTVMKGHGDVGSSAV